MTMGSAGKGTLIALLMIAGLLQSTRAASFTVGGNTGWTLGVAASFYDDWAKPLTFVEGDKLDFTYAGTTHNVYEVSKADLASCNLAAPLKTYDTAGGASVPLATSGNHYYICGVTGHCLANMKMSIVVSAALTPASPPTSAPAPSKKAPAPSKTPLAPASSPGPVVLAPAPALSGKSMGHRSVGPATMVGALIFVVTSLLFQ